MTEEKTPGQFAYEAWEDSDGLNRPRRQEFHDLTGNVRARWEAAASAVREKVIEECAAVAYAHQNTEGEAIAQELLGKICVMRGHRYGQLIGGLLDGMLICNDCAAVLEASATNQGDRTASQPDQRELETNLSQDGVWDIPPTTGETK